MSPEKRETWKFYLDVFKTLLQAVGLVALVFAFLSYRESILKGNQDTYRYVASDWNNHLQLFLQHPELRPYFADGKSLPADEKERLLVQSVADIRLDKMDAILSYFKQRGASDAEITGWIVTFGDAFRRSPALCASLASR